jgi:hypothetical protein
MAREAKGWEALCFAAATERNPEKLQEILVELNVLLDTRQEELENRLAVDSSPQPPKPARWH